jgi:hypothetical protein
VAVFHEYLEMTGKLECPAGFLGLGTAPQQGLAAQAVLFAVLSLDVAFARRAPGRAATAAGAVLLGVGLAAGAVLSAPPMPKAPDKPYETSFDMCRPPFQPS